MTTTAPATDKLPIFEGDQPEYSVVKFSGTGTGFSDGQRIAPVAMHKGDVFYFVLRATVGGVDHHDDKDGITFRRHDLKIDEVAPISDEIAVSAMQEYAQEIERIKSERDPQPSMFEQEQAALDREALDRAGDPGEIATAAADRAKGK